MSRLTDRELLKARGLPSYTVVTDHLRRMWERIDAEQDAKRRQHARKASRAAIRLPMS